MSTTHAAVKRFLAEEPKWKGHTGHAVVDGAEELTLTDPATRAFISWAVRRGLTTQARANLALAQMGASLEAMRRRN